MFRRPLRRPAVLVMCLAGLATGAAHAGDPAGPSGNPCAPLSAANAQGFAANTNRIGLVDLRYFGAGTVA